jgi:hypothetical protein
MTTSAVRCAACSAELPAGALICGECGRSVSSTAPVSRHGDTAKLDPFPWGLPHESTASTEPEQPPAAVEPVVEAPVADQPAVAAPAVATSGRVGPAGVLPMGERFVLQFSTGESFSVTGSGIVGRNPHPEPGEYFDHVVTIADPGKSVSKTHLEFGQDEGLFWISDRFSGNGTVARDPEGQPRRCEPGRRYRVARGGRVDIGDQFFVVS